jgi:glycosyltransferase involved in cell wall biosynthesis
MPKPVKGIVLAKYGDLAASTRQRFLQFGSELAAEGLEIELLPFFPNDYLKRTFAGNGYPIGDTLRRYASRIGHLRQRPLPGFLWIQFDALPFLPYALESALYPPGSPRIYDFDDAIFHQYEMNPNPAVRALVGKKFEPLLRAGDLAICGNAYLNDYASRFCKRSAIVPTVLDTDVYLPAPTRPAGGPVTIGWIGSPSTWGYVRPILPVLEELIRRFGVRVRVIGAGPQAGAAAPGFEFLDWSQQDEIAMIQGMDIGIMPLPDEPWARGKCGYKLIQYMACGLPAVASPVGVNREIVEHEVSGFHASNPEQWFGALAQLIESPLTRAEMGVAGRERAVRDYSRQAHGRRLAALIREVVDAAPR